MEPKVGVAVLLIKDKKILLGMRKGSHGKGTWAPPGGHLEFFEEIEDCAKREILEETGIKIKNLKFETITNDIFTEENKHYVTIILSCKEFEGEPKIIEPEKCEEWCWFKLDDFPEKLFLPVQNINKKVFEKILE